MSNMMKVICNSIDELREDFLLALSMPSDYPSYFYDKELIDI